MCIPFNYDNVYKCVYHLNYDNVYKCVYHLIMIMYINVYTI